MIIDRRKWLIEGNEVRVRMVKDERKWLNIAENE